MSEPELLTAIDGPIARITFNRPHVRNALTAGMVETMCKFLEQVELDPVVRCVVMTGAGEHFMAGGDVAGFAASLDEAPDDRRRSFEQRARVALPVFSIMERLSKPIIAKVRGAVAGASIGWVAASDLVLVSDTARFIAAHVLLGASPDGAISWHLPRNVGLRKAKEMVFFGDPLSAEEAVRFGLANRLVPDAQLDEQTEQWAQRLARGPGVAIGRAKQLLNRAHATGLMEQMDLEAQSFGACAGTEDFVEGVRAFLEKRKAQFKGQ